MRIDSGTEDDSHEYNDNTFEIHAKNWKETASSNMEKAMELKY